MLLNGYNGKISDIAELSSPRHRTSITRFFSKSTWDEELLRKSLKSLVIDLIWTKDVFKESVKSGYSYNRIIRSFRYFNSIY